MDNPELEAEMEPYMDILLDIAEAMVAINEHLERESDLE
jgi:hypothetical protein